ncbi:cation diffusion facilitator family transporter [Maridesulfovibrio ferrireducens]|uniref:cation diffusion facilitator family transporter n=1 Tax=Maridesulfovibrio ferrireducens TaxID=246191 RepID=UPI001A22D18F|nr:cation diffusion facilitator family transporter [Maridesulfovibrio ferrireducens]MBI9111151.1 cation transporter [Maridesulfovibrio ferrireducens]
MSESPKKYIYYSITASIVTLVLKFWAWHITDSVGLLSDAMETLVNLSAGLFALAALTLAMKPADHAHTYGHGKAEYFSSGAEGMLILIAAIGIVYASIERFISPSVPNNLLTGLLIALLSSAVNFITAKIMLKGAKIHDSIILEADAKHLLTDVWTSIGLVLGLGVMLFTPPSWAILDPIIAIIMALNIIFTGFYLIKKSYSGLMDNTLPKSELSLIDKSIRKCAGEEILYHGLRTRKAGSQRFIDFHLLLPGKSTIASSHTLCSEIEICIKDELKNCHVTIHVEPEEDKSSYDCEETGGLCGSILRSNNE